MPGEEIFFLSISELSKRIESKKLSPVELTELYLDRSQKFGPRFNAYATLTPEIALEQAKAAERDIQRGHYRGSLHGIPYAAKDLLAVKGVPTTWGAKPFVNQVFEYNATIIDHLKNVGAVMIGKAAMIELAGGMGYRFASASLQGEAKNPWDSACWTCGSSSGSGAIVAGGLAGFAIGTETWGSIICPSAFCGVSGLRPTYGRVSRYGAMALAPSMDKISLEKNLQRHEGNLLAGWPVGRGCLPDRTGGVGRFLPPADSLRKNQRTDRSARAGLWLLERAIFRSRLWTSPQSARDSAKEN